MKKLLLLITTVFSFSTFAQEESTNLESAFSQMVEKYSEAVQNAKESSVSSNTPNVNLDPEHLTQSLSETYQKALKFAKENFTGVEMQSLGFGNASEIKSIISESNIDVTEDGDFVNIKMKKEDYEKLKSMAIK